MYATNGWCKHSQNCHFAHGPEQLSGFQAAAPPESLPSNMVFDSRKSGSPAAASAEAAPSSARSVAESFSSSITPDAVSERSQQMMWVSRQAGAIPPSPLTTERRGLQFPNQKKSDIAAAAARAAELALGSTPTSGVDITSAQSHVSLSSSGRTVSSASRRRLRRGGSHTPPNSIDTNVGNAPPVKGPGPRNTPSTSRSGPAAVGGVAFARRTPNSIGTGISSETFVSGGRVVSTYSSSPSGDPSVTSPGTGMPPPGSGGRNRRSRRSRHKATPTAQSQPVAEATQQYAPH